MLFEEPAAAGFSNDGAVAGPEVRVSNADTTGELEL
jgi:hypothetical protein